MSGEQAAKKEMARFQQSISEGHKAPAPTVASTPAPTPALTPADQALKGSPPTEEAPAEPAPEIDMTIPKLAGLLIFGVEYNDKSGDTFWISWLKHRGLTTFQCGACVSLIGFGFIFLTPLAPSIIKKFGANKTQYCAAWVYLVFRLGFWACYYLYDTQLFICCSVTFFLMGCAACFQESAAQAWALSSVPTEKRPEATAIMYGVRFMGGLIGPVVGGSLFVMGGYMLATMAGWFVYAALLLCTRNTVLANPTPPDNTPSSQSGSILKNLSVALSSLMFITIFLAQSFFYVWLQPFMINDYGLNQLQYGLLCGSSTLIFAVFAQIGAGLAEKKGYAYTNMLGISLWCAFGVFVGPTPLLPFLPAASHGTVWVPMIGFYLFCIGVAIMMPGLTPLPMNFAIKAGWGRDDAAAQNAQYGLMGGGLAILLGPWMGGLAVDTIGVQWTSTLATIIGATLFISMTGLLVLLDRKEADDPKAQHLLGI